MTRIVSRVNKGITGMAVGLFSIFINVVFAEEIKDIKPPVFFPYSYMPLIIIFSLVLLATSVFLVKLFLNKIKKGQKEFAYPSKPAHQIAYEALELLRNKNLPVIGNVKEYYIDLSDIVRHYIENRFDIRAPEMTTEEFLFSLRDSGDLTGTHKNLLKEFLSHCDMVKFAKYGPTQEEIEGSFNVAKKLVDETKAQEAIEVKA